MTYVCSCYEICININNIDCSDDGSIAEIFIVLRGKHAVSLQDQLYSLLQNESTATIDFLGKSYSLVFIIDTFYTEIPTVSATTTVTSKKYTTELVVGISALFILVFSILLTIIAWFVKHCKKGRLNLTTDIQVPDNSGSHGQSDICSDHTNTSASPTTLEKMSNEQVLHPQIVLSIQLPDHDSSTSCNCHPAKKWDKSQSQPVYVAFNTRQAPYSSYDRACDDTNVMPQDHAVMPHFFSNRSTDV